MIAESSDPWAVLLVVLVSVAVGLLILRALGVFR